MKTYISLFSSAGIGCYGFKQNGFECIATNELIKRRLDIQKFNKKCKYESGYICGDITDSSIKDCLFSEIKMWEKAEKMKRVDVVIATPPCQGMSVANHKKSNNEIVRNSLVVESIKIICAIKPRFFIFENVPAFMKTICTDLDGVDKPIAEAIDNSLGGEYSYTSKVINFKDYGACSSRQRTLVIGVANDYANEVSPLELYPDLIEEKTLREVIGDMPALSVMGEIDNSDIYHAFRAYPEHMREWIHDLKEGQSAFENEDDNKKPHQIKDGKIVINQQKNGDKYKRQYWNKVGPCIHTRNDQLASQNTVHPSDDRVFSIRELMKMMTVPFEFKWVADDFDDLNNYPDDKKHAILKKEEIKIRQSLGEAVPTAIFYSIASKISSALSHKPIPNSRIKKIISDEDFSSISKLLSFIKENPHDLSVSTLGRIAELTNTKRTDEGAFFTSKPLITEMIQHIPDNPKEEISILEPSVGVGNFIPLIIKKFEGKIINLDVVDIDEKSIEILKTLLSKYDIPETVRINYIVDDFLLHEFDKRYDYIIGNPPFFKMKAADPKLKIYRQTAVNKNTTNICSFFLDKALALGDYVSIVFPKFLLNTPEFKVSREYLSKKRIEAIIDYGEKGFPGVLVETIALLINNEKKPSKTLVLSYTKRIYIEQKQSYIFDPKLPYWIIYRNAEFDKAFDKMEFDVFTVFRDRQITNSLLHEKSERNDCIRVLKSRNISDDGKVIQDIPSYDAYIYKRDAEQLSVFDYLNAKNVYITPNMTYYPRMMRKPEGCLVNGSLAILIPKSLFTLTEQQMEYYSTDEYRAFYQIARNYQTRSLNVDTCSVYFYGILK